MSNRFYINCQLAPGPVSITGPEAHHLAAVCRLRPGDAVCLFNGDGRQYPATVQEVSRKAVTVEILGAESPQRELGFRVEVAAPLPKADRGQFLLEKLTELGATCYTPLRTRRSVVNPGVTRLDKLERYVIEASKQCGRNVLMRVEPPADWDDYCRRGDLPPLRCFAHPGGQPWEVRAGQDVVIAVGPEGGFTDEETAMAQSVGWQTVGLGPRMMRIETAALVLATLAGFAGLTRGVPFHT
jgi:16S rRNA (uracil1498-N3)-methyltransferase